VDGSGGPRRFGRGVLPLIFGGGALNGTVRIAAELGAPTALLVSLCACGGYHVPDVDTGGDGDGALYAGEDDLTFVTSVTQEGSETLSFTLYNSTATSMQVTGHQDVDGPTPEAFVAGDAMPPFLEIAAHGYAEIPVTFRPAAQRDDYEGMVIVRALTDDVDPVLVRLFGTGLAPVLSAALEGRPEAPVGCSADATLVVGNAGGEALHVDAWDTSDLGPFALLDELPSELPAGAQAEVPVRFTPALAGQQVGLLRASSDDPARPDLSVTLAGTGREPEIVTETFHYSSGGGASVLLLMEDTTAGSWSSKVQGGLDDLVNALAQRGVGYRIAAASTETTCPGTPAWSDDTAVVADVVDQLEDVLFDGTAGLYGERLLELARRAAEQSDAGECLDGWLQSGDPLHVVVFAELDDASSAGWEAELTALRALVAGDVVVSGVLPSPACGMGSVQDYEAVVSATGGSLLDLCAASWTRHFEELAARTAAVEDGPTVHTLARKPIGGTVEVTVDGGLWTGIAIDEASGVVSFPTPPEDGAEVRVTYVPADICP
jgi:hypothetical protein